MAYTYSNDQRPNHKIVKVRNEVFHGSALDIHQNYNNWLKSMDFKYEKFAVVSTSMLMDTVQMWLFVTYKIYDWPDR